MIRNSLCTKGIGEKESSPSKENEKQSLSETEVSFTMDQKNEKKTFTNCGGQLQVDDMTQHVALPSRTPTYSLTVSFNSLAQERDAQFQVIQMAQILRLLFGNIIGIHWTDINLIYLLLTIERVGEE